MVSIPFTGVVTNGRTHRFIYIDETVSDKSLEVAVSHHFMFRCDIALFFGLDCSKKAARVRHL